MMRVTNRACVFVGPSLAGHSPSSGIDVFPPATLGALDVAVRAGCRRIGLIDGAIEDGSRLPLGELKRALAAPGISSYRDVKREDALLIVSTLLAGSFFSSMAIAAACISR